MDPVTGLITRYKVPIGAWGALCVEFLTNHLEKTFDAITAATRWPLEGSVRLLLAVPPPLLILTLAAIAFALHRSWRLLLLVALGLLYILNQGLWQPMVETLVLVIYATFVSLIIGMPIGILCARRPRLYAAITPVLDMMQTIPTFVYLVPTLIFFGLGFVPGLVATVIYVVPAPIRLTYLGISRVPKPLIEAGEAFGYTRRQLLWKVKLPAALPTLMAGVNQTIMLSLSMVVIAALVGAQGLGALVVRALGNVDAQSGIEAGIVIVVVAIILDRILSRRSAAIEGHQ
ncbi:MAG TPA: choline ABC transporter permease subunit [Dongiaceae bacterium]|jgi:glycine betaine/proline transport system permease protein|nr:choline ABC transporter permease subunit [Dongiaceae bacterium]